MLLVLFYFDYVFFLGSYKKIVHLLNSIHQNTFPKLEHPGKIFFFNRPNAMSNDYWIYETPKHFFSKQMLLRKGIINHHRGKAYKEAFDNVDLGNIQSPLSLSYDLSQND